jgi:Cytochrome c554 and c-prime
MKIKITLLLCLLFLPFSAASIFGADFKYAGAAKCKICHKKEKTGNQYGIWQQNRHSKAYQVLASDEAKRLALEIGVSSNPQEAKACLICHTPSQFDTKGNKRSDSRFLSKYQPSDGVQCEDCHGAGEKYRNKRIMIKIGKEGGAALSPTAREAGMVYSDEKVCLQCHVPQISVGNAIYRNPAYKDFDFKTQAEIIKHPIP